MKREITISLMLTLLIMISLFSTIQAAGTDQTTALDKLGNDPPAKPSTPVCDKTSGGIGTQFTFTTSTTDPDGHRLYYLWDWGDGVAAEWQGPKTSGETVTKTAFWLQQNDSYKVRVKAIDDPFEDGPKGDDAHRLESEWSDPCPIAISKSSGKLVYRPVLQTLLENLLTKFPLFRYILLIRS